MSSRRWRKGGDREGQDTQAVVEILPEVAPGDFRLQAAVGGGNHPHVQPDGFFPTHRPHLVILKHPQQLGLQVQGHLSDFIQENGSAMGQLERSPAVPDSPGESALLVTEELAFQQVFWHRRRVDRHKRAGRAGAFGVDGLGQVLLADAGFTQQQNRRIAGYDLEHLLHEELHGLAFGNEIRNFGLFQPAAVEAPAHDVLAPGLQGGLHGLDHALFGNPGVEHHVRPGGRQLGMLLGGITVMDDHGGGAFGQLVENRNAVVGRSQEQRFADHDHITAAAEHLLPNRAQLAEGLHPDVVLRELALQIALQVSVLEGQPQTNQHRPLLPLTATPYRFWAGVSPPALRMKLPLLPPRPAAG